MSSRLEENRNLLEQLRRECSIDLLGIADVRGREDLLAGLSRDVRRLLTTAVVIAVRVSSAVLSTLEDGPNLPYLHHCRQLNVHLDRAAAIISSEIEGQGRSALPIRASQIVDWERMAGQVSHPALAGLAGLGWQGNGGLLVTPLSGAQVRLTTILTDLPLTPDSPLQPDCRSRRCCIVACPTKAIGDSPSSFSLPACYEKLSEFSRTRRIGQHICGMCVKAHTRTGGRL